MPAPTPYEALSLHRPVLHTRKQDLLGVSRTIELFVHATASATVHVCLQDVSHLTPCTARTYVQMARSGTVVHLYGVDVRARTDLREDLSLHDLSPHSLLAQEWNVLVVRPHGSMALAAREEPVHRVRRDRDRRFRYVTTTDADDIRYAVAALPTASFVP